MNARRNFIPTEDKLKESIFFVEANSYEQLALWREVHEKHSFEQDPCGGGIHVGNINDDASMSVHICLSFYYVYGYRVCFYYPTSRFVDYTMIEQFFEKNYPVKYGNNTKRAMTDAMNFYSVVAEAKELCEQKAKEIEITA
jgi:hypothetical protein